MRFDLSPKPAYFKLKELLQKTWHTEETLVSDGEGSVSFRGFYGDYRVEIEDTHGTRAYAVKLSKKGENTVTLVI